MKFLVTYRETKEVQAVVEAPSREIAERTFQEAAEASYLDGFGWECEGEASADDAEDDEVADLVYKPGEDQLVLAEDDDAP